MAKYTRRFKIMEQQIHLQDPEGEMAKADLYRAAKSAMKLFDMIKDNQDLEGWVQAKITKASDYLDGVYHYLEYQSKFGHQGGPQGLNTLDDLKGEPVLHDDEAEIDLDGIDESITYEQQLEHLLESAKKKEPTKPAAKNPVAKNAGINKGGVHGDTKYNRKKDQPKVDADLDEGFGTSAAKLAGNVVKGALVAGALGAATAPAAKQKPVKEPTTIVKKAEKPVKEVRKATPITGTKKVARFDGDFGASAEVRFSPEHDEYQVHFYKDGKHLGEKSVYYAFDKQDAIETAKHEVGLGEGKKSNSKKVATIEEAYYTAQEVKDAKQAAAAAKLKAQKLTKTAKTGKEGDAARRAWKEHDRLHSLASSMTVQVKESTETSKEVLSESTDLDRIKKLSGL